MKKVLVRFTVFVALMLTGLLAGCFNRSDNSLQVVPLEQKLVTNVRFVISGVGEAPSIRAAGTPQVMFQLQLLDQNSTTTPIVLFKKSGTVSASGGGYQTVVEFTNVPVLPALAKMTITGGHIVDSTDSKSYSTWVGLNDLVTGPVNTITLYGEGSKTAADVAVNLLERLIATPNNVYFLALPIIAKVNSVVAGLNLTLTTVYDDAYSAYTQLYPIQAAPVDAEFALPTGYTSVAYPKKDATTNLSISSFSSTSQVYLAFLNRSAINQSPSWSVSRSAGNIRGNVTAEALKKASEPTNEQRFHLWLRDQSKKLPPAQQTSFSVKANLRAVALNDPLSFLAYIDHDNNTSTAAILSTINAKCVKVVDVAGTTKKTYFFLDNDDAALSGVSSVIDGMAAAWAPIYAKNREIFGAEPEGILNTINVDDFYILMSRKIYTAGYFYSGDLYLTSQVSGGYSNQKKMFYLQYPDSIVNLTYEIDSLASTMAHEFQHMIHFKQNPNQIDWLDETMSGYAEFINDYKIENGKNQSKALQVQRFFDTPSTVSLTNWGGNHESYGEVYLFGVWLAQNFGSNGSVQSLLSLTQTGTDAVAAFSGQTFDTVFAKFMMALAVNDTAGGIYGFKNFSLTATYSFPGLSDVTLYGPKMTNVDFTSTTSGSPAISPYAAAYVKITNGTGTTLNANTTLPTGVSLFQLKKN